jgi:hypothetical protein
MRNMKVSLLLVAVCLLICVDKAEAVGNIHFGKLQIDPYVSVSEIWTDNVYYTPTDELSDRIAVFTPGVQLQFPFGMHRFEAEYYETFNRYNTFPGEDTTDHVGHGLLDLKFGSYLGLTLSDDYVKGHEDRGESATGFIEVYRQNTPMASAYYQLAGRSKVQVDYSQTSYNFMVSNFRDRDERFVAGYLYYRFLPKTSMFVEYDHRTADYTLPVNTTGGLSLDNAQDSAYIGITWEATAISKGTIKAGRTKKDFEAAGVTDLTMWSWSVNIDHHFSDLTWLRIIGLREPREANYFGTSYYITTGASMDFSHRMLSKTDVLLSASYGKDDFSSDRKDTTKLLGGGLKYWIKDWWDVGVAYRLRKRDSNLDTADYTEHRTLVSMDMMF